MHRSASTNRFSDDHYSYYSSSPSSKVPTALRTLSSELPIYEPLSDAAKKERTRAKFAENAVHIIPIVLLLCCFILWFFSNPEIDMRGSSITANIEGMENEGGDLENDGTGHLPVDLADLDHPKLRDANIFNSHYRYY